MDQELTIEQAYTSLQHFFQRKPLVLFGTGTSCAVDPKFGMDELRVHLLQGMPTHLFNGKQSEQWDAVRAGLADGYDLETSMNPAQDEQLIRWVIECTAAFVGALDREYSVKLMTGEQLWPAASLIKRMVDHLSDSDPVLHMATPNYDLLAEYALDHMAIPYINGFYGGMFRRWDWKQSERSVTYVEKTPHAARMRSRIKLQKHIRIYKVHGSLNTFKHNGVIIENNAWMYEGVRGNYERLMVTPGMSKYESLHRNRTELLHEYDVAVEKHHAFLFIGFGFNDNQLITDSIKRKLREQRCPAIIITRDENPRMMKYIHEHNNIWLVCKHPDPRNEGTRIMNAAYGNRVDIADKSLWNAAEFTRVVLGG